MTRDELRDAVRFLFGDTYNSNMIFRESLLGRPGNVIDGNNRAFFMLNRRISEILDIYDEDNTSIPPTDYTLTSRTGKLVFNVPPTSRLYVDYSWYKLTDDEINTATIVAAASGNFDPNSLAKGISDYAIHYIVANCYLAAASKAAEYYTLSAAGKQVSKSELFNHYIRMAEKFEESALKLRTDQRTERGDRDIPAEADSADLSDPYFPADGGF